MATKLEVKQTRTQARTANAGRRKRKRKRNRTLHYLILLVFLLGAGATLSLTVLFKIEAVEVLGAEKYTPDEIAAATGVELEENLLRIDKKQIRQNILEQFPYIDSVEVRRKLPPRVEVTVTQATPAGAISLGDEVVLIDLEGKVLERGVLIIPEGVIVIKGIDASDAVPGQVLGAYTSQGKKNDKPAEEEDPTDDEASEQEDPAKVAEQATEEELERQKAETVHKQLVMFRYLVEAMEASEFTNLTNVDVSDQLNMRILYENRITLELGVEAQLTDKLILCKYVLERHIGASETGTLTPEMNREQNRVVYSPGGQESGDVAYSLAEQDEPQEAEGDAMEEDSADSG